MHEAKTHITECHTCDILGHSHTIAGVGIFGLLYRNGQIVCDHFHSLDLEHVRHLPCGFGDIAFDSVCEGVHTGSGGKALGEAIHQLGVDDGYCGDIVGVNAYHLLLFLLIDNHVVDSGLGCSAGSCRQSDDRHTSVLGGSAAFERYNVGKVGVVDNNTNTFGCINRRTATDSYNKVGTCFAESVDTVCYVRNGRIGLDVAEDVERNTGFFKNVGHHFGHTEFDKAGIGDYESFFNTHTADSFGEHLASTRAEIRYLIEDKSIDHGNWFIKDYC